MGGLASMVGCGAVRWFWTSFLDGHQSVPKGDLALRVACPLGAGVSLETVFMVFFDHPSHFFNTSIRVFPGRAAGEVGENPLSSDQT